MAKNILEWNALARNGLEAIYFPINAQDWLFSLGRPSGNQIEIFCTESFFFADQMDSCKICALSPNG